MTPLEEAPAEILALREKLSKHFGVDVNYLSLVGYENEKDTHPPLGTSIVRMTVGMRRFTSFRSGARARLVCVRKMRRGISGRLSVLFMAR